MEKRNLTLSLPYALIHKAKELAVREDTSLNEYVRRAVEERISRTKGYGEARKRQTRRLKGGLDLGTKGRRPTDREGIHER